MRITLEVKMSELISIFDAAANAYRELPKAKVLKQIEEAKKLESIMNDSEIVSFYDAKVDAYREMPKAIVEKMINEAKKLEDQLIAKGII